MSKLRVLDLFSGIGGFSLGLERTGGFETVAFCEIEEFPRRVLAKHWPEVPCYEDVRELTAAKLSADGITGIDVITGGFPCQDVSTVGRQAGIGEGTRSGLWSEIVRLACEIRPSYLIVENVSNLLSGPSEKRGGWFGRVLGDLAECGYDAIWRHIRASELGAPHHRGRVWIIAYSNEIRRPGQELFAHLEHEIQAGCKWTPSSYGQKWRHVERWLKSPDADHLWEATDREACRVDDGVRSRLDRHDIAALGNAVVPQIPEMIGRAILEAAE